MSKLSLSKRKRARVDMQMQMQKQQQEKEEEEAKNSLGSTMLVQERDIIITEAKEREQDDGPSPTKRRRAHVNVGHGSKQQHDGDESSQDSSSSSSSSIDQHSVSSILTKPINNDEDADDEKEYLSPMQSPSMTANGDSKDKERMQEQELATPKRSGTALALNMMSQGTFAIGNGGGKIATTSNSIGNDRATSASASANASTSANASSAGGRLILTGHGDNVTPKRSGAALKPHPPRDDDSGSSEHGDSGRPLKKNRLQEPSSCESEDEGDDEDEAKGEAEGGSLPDNYSYLERVNANMKRNKQRLVDLGYMEKPPTPHIVIPKDVNNCNHNGNGSVRSIEDGDDDYGPMETTGMIFATRTNGLLNKYQDEASFSRHHDIFEDFPHRKRQISLLQSCLWNPVRQMEIPIELDVCGSILNSYTPPPLFVTGPSGTGKTSVVRRILRDLQQDRERDQQLEALKKNCGGRQVDDNVGDSEKKTRKPIGVAYINCSTIEPYGTGPSSILESTYTQLVSQMAVGGGKRGKRMRKRNIGSKRLQTGSSHSLQSDGLSSCSISFDLETDEDSVACSSLGGDSYSRGEDPDDENMDASVGNGDEEDMIENLAVREKIGFVRDATTKSIQSEKPRLQEDAPRRSSRLGVPSQDPVPWKNQTNPGQPPVKMPSSGLVGILSTPASFGRSIAHFCGASEYNSFQRGCAFLVLDCADKLLSFSHQKQRNNAHTNFLSELLLLPKIMKLNLTIIVITDKLMLENSSKF
jgi:Cdc6-like AAA superfamily ATPase